MASIWGGDSPSVAWGVNSWESNTVTLAIDGVSFQAYQNADGVLSFPEQGWGSDLWGDENWGESGLDVSLTGQEITTGYNSSVTITNQINVGWGSDTYGYEDWGESGYTVEVDGLDIGTVSVGQGGWGTVAYGNGSWGMWTLTPEDVVGLSGQSITASQGTSTVQVDYVDIPDGLSFTAYQGSVSVNNGADMTVGLAGQSVSSSVGAITPADVVGLTGVSFTAYQNAAGCSFTPIELIDVTGVSFTASVGAITPDAMTVSFSGVSFSGSVGSISPTEMSVGLTGVEFNANVGELYPVYFKDVDIESSAGYEDVDIEGSTTYTDVNIAA